MAKLTEIEAKSLNKKHAKISKLVFECVIPNEFYHEDVELALDRANRLLRKITKYKKILKKLDHSPKTRV